MINYFIFT